MSAVPTMPAKMKTRMVLAAILAAALSACGTLYSTSRDWKLPAGLGHYTLSARVSIGLLTRQATISVNGRDVLSGESWIWSDTIAMSGSVEGLPIEALCDRDAKTCDVSIAGMHAALLKF